MTTTKIYTPEDIAGELKIAVRTVKARAYSRQWPCQRLGERTVRFTQEQYDEILRLTLSGPADQLSNDDAKKRVRQLLKAS